MREGEAQIAIEDRESVKIMTIHAAKGLQFPMVMVPFLNEKHEGRFISVYMDNELGLVTARRVPYGGWPCYQTEFRYYQAGR